jgi:NitT/TauT family transport system ATP-binding protein
MIKVQGVTKKFGEQHVLSGVTLEIEKSEWVCFFGNSGCGKTTLLNTMAGVLKSDSGTVTRYSKRIGYVFQHDNLLEWKTVEENLMFALLSYFGKKPAEEYSREWLVKLGLYDFRNKRPGEMSGGMKRRLNIARALAIHPDILFLDEPFAFLDEDNIDRIKGFIVDLVSSRATVVVMVTHSLEHLSGIPHRLIRINDADLPIRISSNSDS